MATTIESQGVEFQVGNGDGPPETFTKMAGVTGINGLGGGQAAVIDVTDLDSAAKEKRMGLPDEGQITLNVNYNPDDAQQTALETARSGRTQTNFQVVLTDTTPTTFAFAGYVLSFAKDVTVDDVVKASVTIEISGAVTKT